MISRLSEKDKKKVSYFEFQISKVKQGMSMLDYNCSIERDKIHAELSEKLTSGEARVVVDAWYENTVSSLLRQEARISREFEREIAEAERQIDAIHKSSYLRNFKAYE